METERSSDTRIGRALRELSALAPDEERVFCRAVELELAEGLGRDREPAGEVGVEADEAVRLLYDGLLDGGKRVRSRLLWRAWQACSRSHGPDVPSSVLKVAAGLELVQACAVVHDDIMDGSSRRRSAPTLHLAVADEHRIRGWTGDSERYGVSMAILAGDLALARADDLVAEAVCDDRAVESALRRTWRRMRMDMVAGQVLELRLQAQQSGSSEQALAVASLKSGGYSVQRPLELGADLAGATADQRWTLSGFGRKVGLAFQLADDLRDLFGTEAELGKEPGSDVVEGKRTYLVLRAMESAAEQGMRREEDVIRTALLSRDSSGLDVRRVQEAVERIGTDREVRDLVGRLRDEAFTLLDEGQRFGSEARRRLTDLAQRLTTTGPYGQDGGVPGRRAPALRRRFEDGDLR